MSRRKRRISGRPVGKDWESRCRQCGFCCLEKFETDDGSIYYTQGRCEFLDPVTRQCTVYDRRFSVNPDCVQLTPELAERLTWLPPDCGYRNPAD